MRESDPLLPALSRGATGVSSFDWGRQRTLTRVFALTQHPCLLSLCPTLFHTKVGGIFTVDLLLTLLWTSSPHVNSLDLLGRPEASHLKERDEILQATLTYVSCCQRTLYFKILILAVENVQGKNRRATVCYCAYERGKRTLTSEIYAKKATRDTAKFTSKWCIVH